MSRTGRLFIPGLWLVGLVTGFLMARRPDLLPLPVPALMGPLLVSLVVDLALRPAAASGRIEPLEPTDRFIGVIGAGLIALASANWLFGGLPAG